MWLRSLKGCVASDWHRRWTVSTGLTSHRRLASAYCPIQGTLSTFSSSFRPFPRLVRNGINAEFRPKRYFEFLTNFNAFGNLLVLFSPLHRSRIFVIFQSLCTVFCRRKFKNRNRIQSPTTTTTTSYGATTTTTNSNTTTTTTAPTITRHQHTRPTSTRYRTSSTSYSESAQTGS